MKPHLTALCFAVLAAPLAWSALQSAPVSSPPVQRYEYKVVGLTGMHGKSLEYLRQAFEEAEGDQGILEGILDVGKKADEQLARKNEDLLNALGEEGWQLVHADARHLILMRPGR